MPDEPQISFGQALEGFQGQISVKFVGHPTEIIWQSKIKGPLHIALFR